MSKAGKNGVFMFEIQLWKIRWWHYPIMLLYCALYPEGHHIEAKELIENWMWEGLLGDVGRLQGLLVSRRTTNHSQFSRRTIFVWFSMCVWIKTCQRSHHLYKHRSWSGIQGSDMFNIYTRSGHWNNLQSFRFDICSHVERSKSITCIGSFFVDGTRLLLPDCTSELQLQRMQWCWSVIKMLIRFYPVEKLCYQIL